MTKPVRVTVCKWFPRRHHVGELDAEKQFLKIDTDLAYRCSLLEAPKSPMKAWQESRIRGGVNHEFHPGRSGSMIGTAREAEPTNQDSCYWPAIY